MFTRPEDLLAAILDLEVPARRDSIPQSAIQALRRNRSQVKMAAKADLSQGYLSELESGRKRLTPDVAARLGPALGVTPEQLIVLEHLTKLNRMAERGELDPAPLLAKVERLAHILPDGEAGAVITDTLLEIVRLAIETYEPRGQATVAAATKSRIVKRGGADTEGDRPARGGACGAGVREPPRSGGATSGASWTSGRRDADDGAEPAA